MIKSDLKKVLAIILTSAAALSATSLVITNHMGPTLAKPQTSQVVVAANTNQSQTLPDRLTSPITGTEAKAQMMFSNGHHWLKIGYNQWNSEDDVGFNYVPITNDQPELLAEDNTTDATPEVQTTTAQAPSSPETPTQPAEPTQTPQPTTTTPDQSQTVASGYETTTTTTSTASVNVVPEAPRDEQGPNTLHIAGYTVHYQDNVVDTPAVNDGSNYNNLPLQNWLNEQTAGVWNINANPGNNITNQAVSTFSTTDNQNSYFIGHNIGALTPLMHVNTGDIISATDSTDNTKNYQVSAIYKLPANNSGNQWIDMNTGENVFDKVLHAGNTEKITLQTCIDKSSIRIVVADAN